ncbi:MAG: hypothetical protein H6867_06405 [Rhodospirillales bacterium]|nr:hypothetical protein [Rhodospirillales bacterium]MCB9995180.1 hypothetical protein [Rhodospirillales bacterium]
MVDVRPQGTFVPSSLDELLELTAAGHNRDIAPVYLKDKDTGLLAVYGSHGMYRFGVHAGGQPVWMFSVNPDAMRPAIHTDPHFRDAYAPGYYIDPDGMDYIDVVEARSKRTPKPWSRQAIDTHNYYLNEVKNDYGFLRKLSDNLWFSRSVAYTLDPATKGRGQFLFTDKGEPLYELRCYTTAGKGWPFSDKELESIRERKTMSFSNKKAYVTLKEAERAIRHDFHGRVDLVMRDHDPNRLGHIKGETYNEDGNPLVRGGKGIHRKAFHAAGHYFVRTMQALGAAFRDIKAQVLVMGFAKAAAFSIVKVASQGWRAGVGQFLVGAFKPVIDMVKRVGMYMSGKEDIGYQFWKPNRSLITGNRHYSLLDPDKGRLIRYLDADESRIKPPRGTALRSELPSDWAEEYLLGSYYAPAGSIEERRQIGGVDVRHVVEPSGLEVYYIPSRKTAYAIMHPENAVDGAMPLPGPVERLLARKGPVIKIREMPDDSLHSERIAPEHFEADLQAAIATPSTRPCLPPLQYDLSSLDQFNKRAMRQIPAVGKLSAAFAAVTKPLRALKLMKPLEQAQQPLSIRTLEQKLAEREVVKAPEHPASHTGPETGPSPTEPRV